LLDLGRIEAEVGLKLEMVSPADIVEEVTDNLQLQARQRGIELQVVPPSQNVPFISADRALLQQALHNLVDNAVDFNVQDGSIWVRYGIEGDQITFEVEDTGIGISPVDQQRLFEKFYRIERSGGDQGSGTGLGLAIVRSIAEQHGGSVWVESELGHGSIFYLSLPIRPSGKKIRSEKEQN
jgi:signal transduction histidine kinase